MFDIALKIFLLLSPIFWLPFNGWAGRYQFFQFGYFSGSVNLLQLQFFQYGTVLLFLTALFSKSQRCFKDKYSGFLFLMFILGVVWHPKTIQNFHNILLGFLLFYLVSVYSKNIKSILKVIVIVSCLNSIWAMLQFFGVNIIYKPSHENITGLMVYKTNLAVYQAIAIPICYVLNPLLSIIPIIGLLLSKSFTATIPAMIGMGYLFKERIYSLRSMPVVMLLLSSVFLFGGRIFHKLSLRFDVWVNTIKEIFEKPFYGHGVGMFHYTQTVDNLPHKISLEYSDPYQIYLQITHALGIFGLICLVLFLKNKLNVRPKSLMEHGLLASCIILVIVGFGYCFMDYARLAGTVIVLFGLLTVIKGEQYENKIFGRT